MHADLDGFERTETNIGKKFSGSASREEHGRLVSRGIFFTNSLGEVVLENFIEPVLSGTLDGVTDECWTPCKTSQSILEHGNVKG